MPLVYALSVSHEIEKIGSYAGFAAVLGLAVLALLYFSQAREVKRLREWAGRSPERAQELEARVTEQAELARQAAVQKRVVAQPQPPKPAATPGTAAGAAAAGAAAGAAATAAPAATPGAPAAAPATPGAPAAPATPPVVPGAPKPAVAPVPAIAAAAAAAAATQTKPGDETAAKPDEPPAATPAAQPTATPVATPSAAPGANDRPAPQPAGPAPATVAGGAAVTTAPAEEQTADRNGTADEPAAVIARPPVPAPAPARAAALRGERPSATIPPRRPAEPARRSGGDGGGRHWGTIGLVVAALAFVGGAAALLITTLGGDDEPKAPNTPGQVQVDDTSNDKSSGSKNDKTVPRSSVVVAVLNGTTVNGLAASVSDKLVSAGYKKGPILTGPDQTRSATIIQYEPGYRDEARDIGRVLKVGDAIEQLDAGTKAIACPPGQCTVQPNVVVTVGADRTAE